MSDASHFELLASDGHAMHCYQWSPQTDPRAVVVIAHGMGEHAARYHEFAQRLTGQGWAVVAVDHRGHGRSAAPENYGEFGPLGWDRVIEDVHELVQHERALNARVPVVLLGHSMGAMLAQQYLYRFGGSLDAAIISGSPGLGARFSMWLSHTLARFERWRLGSSAHSALMQQLVFGNANKTFADSIASPTGFEWLSRDPEQVAEYVADPACGFVLKVGSLCSLLAGAREGRQPARLGTIPKDLPVLVLSGDADPVHENLAGLERLFAAYQALGLQVDKLIYAGGRHEMFNETNREEVYADVVNWLRTTLEQVSPAVGSAEVARAEQH